MVCSGSGVPMSIPHATADWQYATVITNDKALVGSRRAEVTLLLQDGLGQGLAETFDPERCWTDSHLLLLAELLVNLRTLGRLIAVVPGLSMPDQSLLPLVLVAGVGRLHEVSSGGGARVVLLLVANGTRRGSHICWYVPLPCLVVARATYRQCRIFLGLECFLALLRVGLLLLLLLGSQAVGDGALVLGVDCVVGVLLALVEALILFLCFQLGVGVVFLS